MLNRKKTIKKWDSLAVANNKYRSQHMMLKRVLQIKHELNHNVHSCQSNPHLDTDQFYVLSANLCIRFAARLTYYTMKRPVNKNKACFNRISTQLNRSSFDSLVSMSLPSSVVQSRVTLWGAKTTWISTFLLGRTYGFCAWQLRVKYVIQHRHLIPSSSSHFRWWSASQVHRHFSVSNRTEAEVKDADWKLFMWQLRKTDNGRWHRTK